MILKKIHHKHLVTTMNLSYNKITEPFIPYKNQNVSLFLKFTGLENLNLSHNPITKIDL